MDFFKSVFSTSPEPPQQPAEEELAEKTDGKSSGDGNHGDDGGGTASWGAFSGLVKTLVSKSEPLIQTYRRDLEEFGSGLRKETEVFREVIRELPTSIESKASVAQESLETVGQALDEIGASVWRGTADIIAQGKDALLSLDEESSSDLSSPRLDRGASNRLSRFEVKLQAIQADPTTFSEEPEDAEDFQKWLAGINLQEKEFEIHGLLEENVSLQGNLSRLVPEAMDHDTFWGRYFYKIHKLKLAEDLRANLVKRAISGEEEDLSWEVEDDEVEKTLEEEHQNADNQQKPEIQNQAEEATTSIATEIKSEEAPIKINEKISHEEKGESPESCKDSDVSIVSTQPSIPEEDDLGWDEIEDLGDNDHKKIEASVGIPNKVDLHKRLVTMEDDDDLSWDIEDDDPKKP